MKGKLLTILFVGGLVFIGMGDLFLPKPLSLWSEQTRGKINAVLVGAFKLDIERPSKRREEAVEAAQEGTGLNDRPESQQ
ncbi:MAG: hypothetical protein AB4058_18890 [Microcystaceae cyanobacterium]